LPNAGISRSAALTLPDGRAAADALRIGGVQRFTSIDYPGALAAVVFVQGCPWRCAYCHNPHLQPRRGDGGPAWPALRPWLQRRRGLIDAVVFSGGEPTLDPALPAAMAELRGAGFKVGLHTAGLAPARLAPLLPLTDWVALDIKAPLADEAAHRRVTGAPRSAAPVRRSLAALRASGVAHECRTTAHPELHDDAALLAIARMLAAEGVQHYALQLCRPQPGSALAPVTAGWPAPATLARIAAQFPHFTLRDDAGAVAGRGSSAP